MRWPSFREFTESIGRFDERLSDYTNTYKSNHPVLKKLIQTNFSMLPTPLNLVVENIYDNAEGDEDEKISQVHSYLHRLQELGQQHYEQVTHSLDQIDIDLVDKKVINQITHGILSPTQDVAESIKKINMLREQLDQKIDIKEISNDVKKNQQLLSSLIEKTKTQFSDLGIESEIKTDQKIKIKPEIIEQLKERDKEIERLQKSLDNPDQQLKLDVGLLLQRGAFYYQSDDYSKALANNEKILEIYPDNIDALFNQGMILEQMNRLDDALESYVNVLTIHPKYINALINSGIILGKFDKPRAEIKLYDDALDINPDSVRALYNKATAFGKLGELENEFQYYEKVLFIDPDHDQAQHNRNMLLDVHGARLKNLKNKKRAKVSLVIDEPELDNVVLDFPIYADAIVKLISNSTPQFTIALFGKWGTGKTTMMKLVDRKLLAKKSGGKILTTWFYPWKYEHEDTHDSIPFTIMIIDALRNEIEDRIKNGIIEDEKEQLSKKMRRILKGLSVNIGIGIPGLDGQVNYDPSKVSKFQPFWRKKLSSTLEEKTTLEEGIEHIEELFQKINKSDNKNPTKLVVFVDDLDRCRLNKIVEVFESTKIFLNTLGIVFVVGISKEVVEVAMGKQYGQDEKLSGFEYLKKFVQLPITIPQWSKEDIENYVKSTLDNYVDDFYRPIFEKNLPLILASVEPNPREVKRYLNNFIMANEVFEFNEDKSYREFLAIQALQLRWGWLYDKIINNPNSLIEIQSIVLTNKVNLELMLDEEFQQLIQSSKGLVNFLVGEGKLIFHIPDHRWLKYRRASAITKVESSETMKTFGNVMQGPISSNIISQSENKIE